MLKSNQFLRVKGKKFILVIVLFFLFSNVFSTPPSFYVSGGTMHKPSEWVLDNTISGVEFYHAITLCNGENVVFLKFVNTTNRDVKVSWKETFVTTTNEHKAGFAGKKELTISPGVISPVDCADLNHRKIIINSKDIDPTTIVAISNFIYKDITVDIL